MGIDEEGNALIVGSVTSTTPKMTLGGKGGYLNGPSELDLACAAMYSTEMGSARSINIDDVTRVLEYTGERSSYIDHDTDEYTPKKEVLTVGDFGAMVVTDTPDGTDIREYKVNYYYIDKVEDALEITTDGTRIDMIYPVTTSTNLTATYWLASQCVSLGFLYEIPSNIACFGTRCVSASKVGFNASYDSDEWASYGLSGSSMLAIRPVVTLTSDVQISYDETTVTLSM